MNEIVTTTNENNVPVDVDYAIEEWRAYQRLTRELLDETDYQTHRGRKYKTKSAWQKYARAFNINTQIIDKDIVKNDKGVVIEAEYTVRATLPNGRFVESDGSCDRRESGKREMSNHSIKATAKTRATNRAISELIGAGDVSADELDPAFDKVQHSKTNHVIEAEVAEIIESPYDKNAGFETADKIEPVDEDPVCRNWVKTICKTIKAEGKPCLKGVLIQKARTIGTMTDEERNRPIESIKTLPKGEVNLDD